jgi:hypothetical protein
MGLRVIGDLVTDPGRKDECAAVSELRLKLATEAQQDVSLLAPVISDVARRVFNHPNPYGTKLLRPPRGGSRTAVMDCRRELGPIGEYERNLVYSHGQVPLSTY